MGDQNVLRPGDVPGIESQRTEIFDKPKNFRKYRIDKDVAVYVFYQQAGVFQKSDRTATVLPDRLPIRIRGAGSAQRSCPGFCHWRGIHR